VRPSNRGISGAAQNEFVRSNHCAQETHRTDGSITETQAKREIQASKGYGTTATAWL